ncbi:MAG: hypothetical protein J0M00_07060 [Burkholderiales bacterium]|nr:hypothetical protein [Burkholderiales bacterium]
MKPRDLHAVWSAPDNTRLTAKQQSFRLPVHVAAKLAALCELYPNKTRTQIVGDLLASAIDASVEGLPTVKGQFLLHVPADSGGPFDVYEDVGPCARFKESANKHFAELEKELGNEAPSALYPPDYKSDDPSRPIATFTHQEDGQK